MKRTVLTIMVALLCLATIEAKHQKHAEPAQTSQAVDKNTDEKAASQEADSKGDQRQNSAEEADEQVDITSEGVTIMQADGKTVKVKMRDLGKFINNHLDDTLLSIDDSAVMGDETVEDDTRQPQYVGSDAEFMNRGFDLAESITHGFFVAVVFIVLLSLLFYYLHRRRKYKTVDRAIQAGYPLPDEFFGKRSRQMPQNPTTVYVNQVLPPVADSNAAQSPNPVSGYAAPAKGNPINNITDWAPFKGGFITTAVGLGLLFFFWIAGAAPIAALMSIVVFVGLGKLFIAYQEQQSAKNYWQQQQWIRQPQQPEQPQNGQPVDTQQSDDVPPPFNS